LHRTTGRRTRHTTTLYGNPITRTSPLQVEHLRPTSIQYSALGIGSHPSITGFKKVEKRTEEDMWKVQNMWKVCNISPAFINTPLFYQHLIGHAPPTTLESDSIAEEIGCNMCMVCSDVSTCPDTGISSHSWVISGGLNQVVSSGAGRDDSHPQLMSSYCSELGGLLASVYIIHCICQYYNITTGKVTIYCNSKGAITNAFQQTPPRISPYTTSDFDLLGTL
jgi:hypothetical protein